MQEAGKALKMMAAWLAVIFACTLLRMAGYAISPLPLCIWVTVYLPAMAIFLIYHYRSRIAERGKLKNCLLAMAWTIFLFIVIKDLKYNAMPLLSTGSRYIWYLYYVPILIIPLFSFYASLLINTKDRKYPLKNWIWLGVISAVLVVFILTNDFHQQVFSFQDQFYNWNDDYNYEWGYWVIWIYHYLLLLAALVIMIRKCRLSTSKRSFWVPLIPMAVGMIFMIENMFGNNLRFHGRLILGFPEILCYSVAFFWEACIQIGLVPTNESYGKLFHKLSLPVWITSRSGKIIYRSDVSPELEEGLTCTNGDILLDENTVLHGRLIPGGYGIWQEDITEMIALQKELHSLRKQLQEEAVLMQLENERKEEQSHIDQQNAMYDRIAVMTRSQSKRISSLAEQAAEHSEDAQLVRKKETLICVYGAFVKRMSNLMLLADVSNRMESGELYLAISESLRYLARTGVACSQGENLEFSGRSDQMVEIYRLFELILEQNLGGLTGIFVTCESQESRSLRLMLEGEVSVPGEELKKEASDRDLRLIWEKEDDILYVNIIPEKGGDLR